MLIGWYFCCSTSRQLFSCVKTFGSTSEKIIFQLTNNLEKKKVPYFRCELKHISSFPAGNPTKALALGLSTHHARAIVIMSPQGLRWSPYLIGNVTSFWNTNDIESSKMLSQQYYFFVWSSIINIIFVIKVVGNYIHLGSVLVFVDKQEHADGLLKVLKRIFALTEYFMLN